MKKPNGIASAKPGAVSLEDYDIPEVELVDEEEIEREPDFRLTKYIKVFDDALPPNYCDKLIEKFGQDADNHIARNSDGENFISLNIEKSALWSEISVTQRKIIEATMPVYAKSVWAHENCFPEKSMIEDIYMYHFRDENDYRNINVDVTHYGQARRYLTFIWFLTDDEECELGFFDIQNSVSAKKGRLIVFPSTWTYPYSIAGGTKPNYFMKSHITMV